MASLLLAVGSVASANESKSEIYLKFGAALDFQEPVGTLKSGLLCLPNGSLKPIDFFDDAESLETLFFDEVNKLKFVKTNVATAVNDPIISVELVGMKASLCAKRYGVLGTGDKRSLSGSAEFRFHLQSSTKDVTHLRAEIVRVDASSKQPLTKQQIVRNAIRELAMRISAL